MCAKCVWSYRQRGAVLHSSVMSIYPQSLSMFPHTAVILQGKWRAAAYIGFYKVGPQIWVRFRFCSNEISSLEWSIPLTNPHRSSPSVQTQTSQLLLPRSFLQAFIVARGSFVMTVQSNFNFNGNTRWKGKRAKRRVSTRLRSIGSQKKHVTKGLPRLIHVS